MKITSANGVEGVLIWIHILDRMVFRVYDKYYSFKDYEIDHSDLVVTIKDTDAYFYENDNGILSLDHGPETLGKTCVFL
jgi:hypothetical protein